MGIVWTIKGADFSGNAIGYAVPVSDGLAGWWWLGGTEASSLKDLSFNADATKAGAPVFHDGYVEMTGNSNYLQTSVAETESMTILAAGRFPVAPSLPAGLGVLFADYGPLGVIANQGDGAYPSDGLSAYGVFDGAQHAVGITDTDVSAWGFYVLRIGPALLKLDEKTQGFAGSATPAGSRGPQSRAFRIGSGYTMFNGRCDMAFAGFYHRVLTDPEITKVYNFVKTRLAAKNSIAI